MRKLTVAALALVFALLLAAPAFAADGETIPHGGYSTLTDSCLQCHDMHEAAGDYVLMREETITKVCATCHTLYNEPPTGAYIPPYSGAKAGEVPNLEAYKVPIAEAMTHEGHRLGLGSDTYTFADGQTGDGSYIPGGTQALTAIQYLGYPDTVSALEFEATNGLNCASCHTPHGTFGNMAPLGFSTKLLSSRPNHGDPVTGLVDWINDGGKWCSACHDLRAPDPDAGIHNHPDYACLTCHNDNIDDPTDDFPHTSNVPNLLFLEPDELCLQCHVAGLLP